jgi:hypothetical protein
VITALTLALENFTNYQSQPKEIILGRPLTPDYVEKQKGYDFPSIWRWFNNVLRIELERGEFWGAMLSDYETRLVDDGFSSDENLWGKQATITKADNRGYVTIKHVNQERISYVTSGNATIEPDLEQLFQAKLDTISDTENSLAAMKFFITGKFAYLNYFDRKERLILAGPEIGWTDDELADYFGISTSAIRKRRQRLREKL